MFSGEERRESARLPAKGDVYLYLDSSEFSPHPAQLLDTSRNGFRAAHRLPVLLPGQEVRFRHELAAGMARVMWTRINGGHVESGFLVVETWPA